MAVVHLPRAKMLKVRSQFNFCSAVFLLLLTVLTNGMAVIAPFSTPEVTGQVEVSVQNESDIKQSTLSSERPDFSVLLMLFLNATEEVEEIKKEVEANSAFLASGRNALTDNADSTALDSFSPVLDIPIHCDLDKFILYHSLTLYG